jgi:hypothetical protein
MNKVERGEILPLADYETIRERFRNRVIEEKKVRRVSLGEHLSAVFENHDTALLQIQEMLRTERITREDSVQHEIDTYNELVPNRDELSATIFVEIPDAVLRERMLGELSGLEPCFAIEIDGARHPGRNETRGVLPDRTTAVHYVKFPLSHESAEAVRNGKPTVALTVSHPKYQARTELSAATRASLRQDLL